MGIRINRKTAEEVFHQALDLATTEAELPEEWIERTAQVASASSWTLTPALGTALLAKATDRRIDALSLQSGIRRRTRICQTANNRYADALAAASDDTIVQDVIDPVTKPADLAGRRVRALRPWAEPDLPLLRTISRGEFLLHGFRNRDILQLVIDAAAPQPPTGRVVASERLGGLLKHYHRVAT